MAAKDYINKVVSQLVDETDIEYNDVSSGLVGYDETTGVMDRYTIIITTTFLYPTISLPYFSFLVLHAPGETTIWPGIYNPPDIIFPGAFYTFCEEIYGLTKNEIREVWDKYKNIIKNKIKKILFVNKVRWYDRDITENIIKDKSVKILKEQITLSDENTEFMYDAYKVMGLDEEWAIEDLQNLLEWLSGLPDTLTLYRLLYIDEESDINKEELGDHYSHNKKELLDNHHNRGSLYGGYGDYPILITVEVKKDQIDIFNTLHNNILYPHEEEITLKNKGRGSKLINVSKV